MQDSIHIKNPAVLERKIQIFKQGGAKSLHVVSDFDRTLTKLNVNGEKVLSAYWIIRKYEYLSPDYAKRAFAMADKYHPIEKDPDLPIEEKSRRMVEWWHEHMDLLIECGMTQQVIDDIVKRRLLQGRRGLADFLNHFAECNVPLLIFSAGIGNFIEQYLSHEKLMSPNIHIIANMYAFDKEGKLTGYASDQIIHPFNKNEVSISKSTHHQEISRRKNVVLLGDSLGDPNMADGLDHDEVLRIGFLNEDIEKLLPAYEKAYDVVILNDGTMEYPIELAKRILE
ncbi:MAG: haloacid dehalogenase-like hydrolase [Nanoarchaeota archaeon]|nr:haloacid dehalogenase-like hydrolase [Nanoarchaeota archaeon]